MFSKTGNCVSQRLRFTGCRDDFPGGNVGLEHHFAHFRPGRGAAPRAPLDGIAATFVELRKGSLFPVFSGNPGFTGIGPHLSRVSQWFPTPVLGMSESGVSPGKTAMRTCAKTALRNPCKTPSDSTFLTFWIRKTYILHLFGPVSGRRFPFFGKVSFPRGKLHFP